MTAGPGAARRPGWRVGALRGVPIYVGSSWLLIAVVVLASFTPAIGADYGLGVGVAFGLLYAAFLLLSVLAHEAAHALMAQRLGHRVDRIVADLFGGHTVYDGSTSRPGTSAAIAVVGPVTNLVIGVVALVLEGYVPGDGLLFLLVQAVARVNLFVGLFNLVPGLPLDGGFLVEALVWKVSGSRNLGLIVAGWLGRVVSVLTLLFFVGYPLIRGGRPSLYSIVIGGVVAAFLWQGATAAVRAGSSRRTIESVRLVRVLRPVLVVRSEESVAGVLSRLGVGAPGGYAGGPGVEAAPGPPMAVVVTGSDGSLMGLVDLGAARGVGADRAVSVSVLSVTTRQPDGWVVVAPSRDADLMPVVAAVAGQQAPPQTLLVVTPARQILGVVQLADVAAVLGG